ncbi:unnamed protein product [Caenorhabditis auriculariae]|uniref:Uncharacterized protein n=1 Tax=Caenorhabditis auriculariae TaxID=2777116 RepID=A0A8S1HUY2_9PELO|nr:unnamed protein product [Caenorhabditis auriculariae]
METSLRSPEEEELHEKSSRIRTWVSNRMKELEEQNERLRVQNLRCTTQLQMLRSFTEKTRQIKAEMAMSRSITGTLPVLRDENRTSDDSGLTSDDADARRQMSVSIADCTPRMQRKTARGVKEKNGSTTSTSESSPCDDVGKPMPAPRRLQAPIERDSLNSYADDYEFDVEDESFERIDDVPRVDGKSYADYVNLNEFVAIRDDKQPYSEIIKNNNQRELPPIPPSHQTRSWETKLLQVAERCLSFVECEAGAEGSSGSPSQASPYHVSNISRISATRTDSPGSRRSKLSRHSSPRPSSAGRPHFTGSPDCGSAYAVRDLGLGSDPPVDYYIPPDAASRMSNGSCGGVRNSLVPSRETVEKSGYWSHMTDSRVKSLKRRFVVFKNGNLSFYRSSKNGMREEEPLLKIAVTDIKSVVKINQQGAAYAFQLVTSTDKFNFMTESEKTTHEWVSVLSAAVKGATLREMASRVTPLDASISGWMTRVRCGHSKKVFAALVGQKLMFFKNSHDMVPSGFLYVQGAQISEKNDGLEEYSGSSDEQLEITKDHPNARKHSDSLCIQIANEDPVYLMLQGSEEKEKWLYFLKNASGDATLCGTPFEILVKRMMAENVTSESPLWKDLLLTSSEEVPKDTLVTVAPNDKKKTLEIAKACHLFVSVLMRAQAVQYHIDLAQNILSTAIQNEFLKNEVYAQLIKLTSGSMPFGLQGWKLLALAIPLFLPKQYSLLWLLKRHISRWADMTGDEANMAAFCESALDRCLRVGGRHEGPSRLEATSVLTRDVTTTKFPHSISVRLPNGEYQIVEFDGSTEIGQCLSSLCLKLGMRPALLSGYALYMSDPVTQSYQLLKGKQKLCDALTVWEAKQRDIQRGKVSADCAAALSLRMRHFWPHLISTETPIEKSFLVWRAAEEIVKSRIPLSSQLADNLAALYAQLTFGDVPSNNISEQQFEFLTSRFYPQRLLDVACIKSLRLQIHSNWAELHGMTEFEAIRIILQVLRKWALFGCDLHEAAMRTSNERKIYLALADTAVHMIDRRHFDVIRTIPYHRLSSFGPFQSDFMLTIERPLPPGSHPDETPKERLTFTMEKHEIEQVTLHLAEYIRYTETALCTISGDMPSAIRSRFNRVRKFLRDLFVRRPQEGQPRDPPRRLVISRPTLVLRSISPESALIGLKDPDSMGGTRWMEVIWPEQPEQPDQ